jgi:hypothetical protein
VSTALVVAPVEGAEVRPAREETAPSAEPTGGKRKAPTRSDKGKEKEQQEQLTGDGDQSSTSTSASSDAPDKASKRKQKKRGAKANKEHLALMNPTGITHLLPLPH